MIMTTRKTTLTIALIALASAATFAASAATVSPEKNSPPSSADNPAPVAASKTTKVYDHKYNITRYVTKQAGSEFVGTSATESVKPTWYRFGHP